MKRALKHIGLNVLMVLVPLSVLVLVAPAAEAGDRRMAGVVAVSVYVFLGSAAVETLKKFIRSWRDNKFITYGPAATVYLLFLGVIVQYYLVG